MSKYLITLTPVESFFFGGEITFTREKDKLGKASTLLDPEKKELKAFNESFSSYIIKSNCFPQQTSLLGMLRYFVLSNNDQLFDSRTNKIIPNKQEDIAKEIGQQSFHINDSDSSIIDYGKIKAISPCFIQRKTVAEWENFLISPKDNSFNLIDFESGNSLTISSKSTTPNIKDYNPKDGLKIQYSGKTTKLEESDIFVPDIRIGIDRDYSGKTKENSLYKQVFYRFSNEYKCENCETKIKQSFRFAFYADLDYIFSDEYNDLVSLGADNSKFILEAQKIDDISIDSENDQCKDLFKKEITDPYQIKPNFNCFGKIVLLSDAYIENEQVEKCCYSINDTVPFRFLISTIETENYYKFSGSIKLISRSVKLNLYQKGSVFYFENENNLDSFESKLNSNKRFYQIGYNYFKTIKK